MKIEQMYTGCLAEAAYYIESNGEALIIDPLREPAPYLEKAARDNARIKYILETHFHADFVSGHQELAAKTGATIVFGPTATPGYPAHVAADGEELKLGEATIKVLHTPGHTMESATYLLRDAQGKDYAIFTGDTLFIGDVGRPDLVQKVKPEITTEYLAGLLYDSLREKIMPLSDDVIVYPGHGAGSACGKNLDKKTVDTLGHQKKYNYALNPNMSKKEFTRAVTEGLVEPPQYFPTNVLMNVKGGLPAIDEVVRKGTRMLNPLEFQVFCEAENALVLDTRTEEEFVKGLIPGSVFIGLNGSFAPWVGALITDMNQAILLVTPEGREKEAVIRMSRVGYDNTIGYLNGGIEEWIAAGNHVEQIDEISAADFAELYKKEPGLNLLDVRKESEFESRHITGAENLPLDFIHRNMSRLNRESKYYLYCAGGYRSVIAASLLKANGYNNLVNIKGGFTALSITGLQKSEYKRQQTML